MNDKPRRIEVAFPLKQASLDSVHEKNVRHGQICSMGYEVREKSGSGRHATVVVPRPWDPAIAERLAV